MTVIELLELYPKYSSVSVEQIHKAIERAERQCPRNRWIEVSDREDAILLYAIHLLELEWQQSIQTAGAAAAIAQGAVANFPSNSTDADADLNRTVYGPQFRGMRDNLPTTTGFVI